LHLAVKLDALTGSSCHGEIALDGVLGSAMTLVAAVDTGEVCRGDRRFDDRATETGGSLLRPVNTAADFSCPRSGPRPRE
jgi:hypothetical protein